MAAAFLLLAALLFRSCSWADDSKVPQPSFSADSIVNSANNSPSSLTPNVLATIYGSNLSYSIGTVSLKDIGASQLPSILAGVQMKVGGLLAPLLFVSPTQINFLIPTTLGPGSFDVVLAREGIAAPKTRITLLDAAPALFLLDGRIAATHADGSPVASDTPASPGEVIVVYGTGLGWTNPRQIDGIIPRTAASIVLLDRLKILLDGETLPAESILYAGITPGYPGLYQINLRLPGQMTSPQPELRVAVNDQMSQSAVQLQVAPGGP